MRCKGGGRGEGARKPGRMEKKREGREKEEVRKIKGGKEEGEDSDDEGRRRSKQSLLYCYEVKPIFTLQSLRRESREI